MSNARRSTSRSGGAQSKSASIEDQFGSVNLDGCTKSLPGSQASSDTGSLISRAGSEDHSRPRSTDRRLGQDVARGPQRSSSNDSDRASLLDPESGRGRTGGTRPGTSGKRSDDPTRTSSPPLDPSAPAWMNLPAELKLRTFELMSTTAIANLYCKNQFHKDFIDTWETAIAKEALIRETERINASFVYEGLSFIEALQKWTRAKGLLFNTTYAYDMVCTFANFFAVSINRETQKTPRNNLRKLAFMLVSLHIICHTPKEVIENRPWGWEWTEIKDFCNDEAALRKDIKSMKPKDFPDYCKIDSADNYCTLIMGDPEFLGRVHNREILPPPGRFMLNSIGFADGDLEHPRHDPVKLNYFPARTNQPVMAFLTKECKLNEIPPLSFAFYVDGESHLKSVDRVVANHELQPWDIGRKPLGALERVAFLEKIKVM